MFVTYSRDTGRMKIRREMRAHQSSEPIRQIPVFPGSSPRRFAGSNRNHAERARQPPPEFHRQQPAHHDIPSRFRQTREEVPPAQVFVETTQIEMEQAFLMPFLRRTAARRCHRYTTPGEMLHDISYTAKIPYLFPCRAADRLPRHAPRHASQPPQA